MRGEKHKTNTHTHIKNMGYVSMLLCYFAWFKSININKHSFLHVWMPVLKFFSPHSRALVFTQPLAKLCFGRFITLTPPREKRKKNTRPPCERQHNNEWMKLFLLNSSNNERIRRRNKKPNKVTLVVSTKFMALLLLGWNGKAVCCV